jgi:uncharacterized protein (DUF433 family)
VLECEVVARINKGKPFSVRFRLPADRYVEAEARRTRRSKSDLVEALTEEAILTRRFAGLAFRGEDWNRRPWVIGSGLDVWELIDMLRSYDGDAERLLADNDLERRHVQLALAYYDEHPEEIDEAIAENRRPVEELQELYPFVEFTGTRP